MDLSACRNKCDADKDCQAFDRYDVNGLSECCLFRKGNRTYTGNAKNRTCFVRSTGVNEEGALMIWELARIILLQCNAKSVSCAWVICVKK